jgi:hypothetical protein
MSIIRSILQKMRDNYGDADMVLGKMTKLQSTIEHRGKPVEELDDLLSDPLGACIHAEELFPFPPDICTNMDLLLLLVRRGRVFVSWNLPCCGVPSQNIIFLGAVSWTYLIPISTHSTLLTTTILLSIQKYWAGKKFPLTDLS